MWQPSNQKSNHQAAAHRWFYFEKRVGCEVDGGRLDACGSRDRTGRRATPRLDLRTFRRLREAEKKERRTPLGSFVGFLTRPSRWRCRRVAFVGSLSHGLVSCCCLEKFDSTEWKSAFKASEVGGENREKRSPSGSQQRETSEEVGWEAGSAHGSGRKWPPRRATSKWEQWRTKKEPGEAFEKWRKKDRLSPTRSRRRFWLQPGVDFRPVSHSVAARYQLWFSTQTLSAPGCGNGAGPPVVVGGRAAGRQLRGLVRLQVLRGALEKRRQEGGLQQHGPPPGATGGLVPQQDRHTVSPHTHLHFVKYVPTSIPQFCQWHNNSC